MRLSPSLLRSEFCCKCCEFDTVDYDLVNVLQDCVNGFGGRDKVMIVISGGNRCRSHNIALRARFNHTGGKEGANTARESMHIYARAADYKMFYRDTGEQISPTKIYRYLCDKYPGKYGIKLYSNRVHFDTRAIEWRSS